MNAAEIAELQEVRELARQHREATKELAARRNAAIRAALAAGHSQTKVAAELGVSRQAVANYERRPTA